MKPNFSSFRDRRAPRPSPPIIRPFTGGWLSGIVLGVEPTREVLFVRANETKRKEVIHWAAETQFALDLHPASGADLRLGQRVRIHCRLEHRDLQADNISIGSTTETSGVEAKPLAPSAQHPAHERGNT